jgi:TetR/AcrR family transcriptional repressor of lmrAB and yxaGH operons
VAVFGSWLEALEERLVRAGFTPSAASRRALLVLSVIEGALILARATRDVGPLIAAREELVALST